MIIFLIGFMGSGKTTIGKRLSKKLKWEFIDIDNYIQHKHSLSIKEIFSEFGEDIFREWERDALHELFELSNIIVATGGGTPCFFDNMNEMNKHGITIYLNMSAENLLRRLIDSKNERPLINKRSSKEEIRYKIDLLLNKRKLFYEQARVNIDGRNLSIGFLEQVIKPYLPTSDSDQV